MGKTKRGKGTKLMALADACGLPLSVCTASASPHEVTLVGETLRASFVEVISARREDARGASRAGEVPE